MSDPVFKEPWLLGWGLGFIKDRSGGWLVALVSESEGLAEAAMCPHPLPTGVCPSKYLSPSLQCCFPEIPLCARAPKGFRGQD